MRDLATFLSVAALIVVFAYISYNELSKPKRTVISDQAVAEPEFQVEDSPLPAVSFDLPADLSFAGERVPL
jgi:membrane-bound lytic murein transglycosylase D